MNKSLTYNYIRNLEQKHALLKNFIKKAGTDPRAEVRVRNLKKEKLKLKDKIAQLLLLER